MTLLDGTAAAVDLGRGISISAPGLHGEAAQHDLTPGSGTRAAEVSGARPALDLALQRAGVQRIRAITVSVSGAPAIDAGGARGPGLAGDPAIVLDVPDLGPEVAQVLLGVDEGGVTTWSFPVTGRPGDAPEASRGADGAVRFVVPVTPPAGGPEGATRGLLGAIGQKVFELLTVPLLEHALPPVAAAAAEHWESRARRVRVRRLEPGTHRTDEVPDLDDEGWRALAAGRSLWFVHGTFSTTGRMLNGLPDRTLADLCTAYGGRVVAFDHHTLGIDPAADVAALAGLVPPGLDLEADVVGYSRGGLVARAMAGEAGTARALDVRRVVHVATPNHGTVLASPDCLPALLDRTTTLLNLAPDGPLDALASSLSVVLTVVKTVARFGVLTLPGLSAMDPGGDFQARLRGTPAPSAVHCGVVSDYEPVGAITGLTRRVTQGRAGDLVMDRVFGQQANDLVVPTAGTFEAEGSSWAIDPARRLLLARDLGVNHGGYFGRDDVMAAIAGWLAA